MSQTITNKNSVTKTATNPGAVAWMLDCGDGTIATVSATNMLHVVEDASLCFRVPMAPAYCDRVLVWQNRVLPVINLSRLLQPTTSQTAQNCFCIMGWQAFNDETEYGVIATSGVPRRVVVTDDKSIAPSTEQAAMWRSLAISFFSHQGLSVPIIDPAALFKSNGRSMERSSALEPRTA